MAAKNFKEVFEEIKANVTTSKTGKPVKSFSRSDFDKLAKAFINEVDYVVPAVDSSGNPLDKEIKPVEKIREMIRHILLDFGVDKQEAQRILEPTYEIKKVDGLYEFCTELIYNYISAGKKLDFITRDDFQGSIFLDEVYESKSKHKDIRTGEEFEVAKKAHKILGKKSKCPKWLKQRL